MVAVTICSDFGAQENKICHCFPICLPWSDRTGCHDLRFLNVEFQASFFTLLFHPHHESLKFLFTFCVRVVLSAYLRLLIFLLAVLIPACDSSSLAVHMMYSEYKLNKQGDNIQSCCTLSHFWTVSCYMCGSSCCFLTRIQVSQEIGKVIWYSYLFKSFPQLWSTQSKALV